MIGNYITDFAASSVRIVVEIDGGCHLGRVRLDAGLARASRRVVRVWSEQCVGAAVARITVAVLAPAVAG